MKDIYIEKAKALGIQAAKKDHWMTPTDEGNQKEYVEYMQDQIDGWSQTCQYQLQWGKKLSQIADEAYLREHDDFDYENWCENYLALLEDCFWLAWAEQHKLFKFWKKYVKNLQSL